MRADLLLYLPQTVRGGRVFALNGVRGDSINVFPMIPMRGACPSCTTSLYLPDVFCSNRFCGFFESLEVLACFNLKHKARPCFPRGTKGAFPISFYLVSDIGIHSFRETVSAAHIAKENDISVSTAIRYFKLVQYGSYTLPRVLSLDEFKGNADGEKFQTIITDAEHHIVLTVPVKQTSGETISGRKRPLEGNTGGILRS